MDPRPPEDAASNPRPPLPPLEDVDSLIARNAPIARTRKRRSENFERCTTATTTGQYLAMGAARKDLKYDIEQGFVMVLDRAPPLAGHQWEATVPRSPPASPQSPRKRPKKVASKALAVAAAEAHVAFPRSRSRRKPPRAAAGRRGAPAPEGPGARRRAR